MEHFHHPPSWLRCAIRSSAAGRRFAYSRLSLRILISRNAVRQPINTMPNTMSSEAFRINDANNATPTTPKMIAARWGLGRPCEGCYANARSAGHQRTPSQNTNASGLRNHDGIVKLTNWGRATGKEGRCPTTAALSITAIASRRKSSAMQHLLDHAEAQGKPEIQPDSAMTAAIQDTSRFAGPGKFAAFLGLTPKQNSSGGKPKQGRISKMGDRYLRKPLVGAPMRCRFNQAAHRPAADVGEEADRQEALQACRCGARQQDGAHRLRNPPGQDRLSGNSGVRSLGTVRGQAHQGPRRHRSRG